MILCPFLFSFFCAFEFSINAALIAFDDVFRAFDAHAWSKHRAEKIEFSRTKSLARICRRTNRTMILNQQKTSVTFFPDLGHVAFFSPDLRQCLQFLSSGRLGLIRLP